MVGFTLPSPEYGTSPHRADGPSAPTMQEALWRNSPTWVASAQAGTIHYSARSGALLHQPYPSYDSSSRRIVSRSSIHRSQSVGEAWARTWSENGPFADPT